MSKTKSPPTASRFVQSNRLSGVSITASHDDPRVIAALEKYLLLCEEGAPPERQSFLAGFSEIADVLGPCLEGLALVQAAVPGVSGEGPAAGLRLPLPPGEGGVRANDEDDALLGDFRIIREIGRGGMGIVYEAEQRSLSRRVALKILPFASVLDPRHLQRFKNEALAAAHLDHPNIVEVYGVGCERGVHFYAMRYVEGQTLAEVIDAMRVQGSGFGVQDDSVGNALRGVPEPSTDGVAADPIPPSSLVLRTSATDTSPFAALSTLRIERPRDFFRLVAELGIQAAEALDHAHQMGIVHRDIKPSNLLVEVIQGPTSKVQGHTRTMLDDGRRTTDGLNPEPRTLNPPKLWITDFGLAHIETGATLTMTGDLLGTLRYMSPEQADGKSAILDHRTDIYSLGVTLYEFLTLQPAFPVEDRQTLLKQIATEEPFAPRKLSASIPVDLETIILKAMAKEPRDQGQRALWGI
ncbi:MAG: serine/threonine-protein kinase [Pirellulales bacterium]